ncbi:MAG: hypothetical protein Q8R04_04985 [Nanoarchaeota archaeon]|nr:hypothetical protein [Nanoarchaeota archaeon]
MPQVTEWDIIQTAALLSRVSGYDSKRSFNYFISADVGHRPSQNLPSVRECFEAFEGLPEGHPLKRRFDPEGVRAGYAILPELVSPDAHYGDIVFINLRRLGLARPLYSTPATSLTLPLDSD